MSSAARSAQPGTAPLVAPQDANASISQQQPGQQQQQLPARGGNDRSSHQQNIDSALAELRASARCAPDLLPFEFRLRNRFLHFSRAREECLAKYQLGLLSEACELLEAHLQAQPEDVDGWNLLVMLLVDLRDEVRARAALRQALFVYRHHPAVLLGWVTHEATLYPKYDGDVAVAMLDYLAVHKSAQLVQAQAAAPAPAAAPLARGSDAHMQHVWSRVLAALQHCPDDLNLILAMGALAERRGQYGEAMQHFKRVLLVRGLDYRVWCRVGVNYCELGKTGALPCLEHRRLAAVFFKIALDLCPGYLRAAVHLRDCLGHLRQEDDAQRRQKNEALHQESHLASAARVFKAQAVAQGQGQPNSTGAARAWLCVLTLEPDSPGAWDSLLQAWRTASGAADVVSPPDDAERQSLLERLRLELLVRS